MANAKSRLWMLGLGLVAAAMAGRAEPPKPQADALVTVFTYDTVGVPQNVMSRARWVVTAAFAAAGIEVRWVEGKRLTEPRKVASGEVLTVVFDGPAPAEASREAMAFTKVGGAADGDVHIFYNRVAGLAGCANRVYMPEFLGNVLAHELTHALEGAARHSGEGLMKAVWSGQDYATMTRRRPLPFAAEDLDLLRAHFQIEMSPAPSLVATR